MEEVEEEGEEAPEKAPVEGLEEVSAVVGPWERAEEVLEAPKGPLLPAVLPSHHSRPGRTMEASPTQERRQLGRHNREDIRVGRRPDVAAAAAAAAWEMEDAAPRRRSEVDELFRGELVL